MMNIRAVTLAAALIALTGAPVAAQTACGLYDSITKELKLRYSETLVGAGFISATARFEIWASPNPPYTWSVLTVLARGTACVQAAGQYWQAETPELPGDDL